MESLPSVFLFVCFLRYFWGSLCLYFSDRTAEGQTGNSGERGGMTCIYGAPALPAEPPGAPSLPSVLSED